jgi:protein SSD1
MIYQNAVYDEYTRQLTLYWKPNIDSLRFSVEASSEAPTIARNHAKLMDAQSGIAQAESALFDDEEEEDNVIFQTKSRPAPQESGQHEKSKLGKWKDIKFEGVEKTANGHHTQKIKE